MAGIDDTFLYTAPPSPAPAPLDIHSALRRYVRNLDPFSDYLTPLEYEAFNRNQSERYSGVGMQIVDRDGRIICLPFPDSPAQRGGIRSGDELMTVDGDDVNEMPMILIGTKVRGLAGSRVWLTVRSSRLDPVRRINLVRQETDPATVHISQGPDGPLVKITGFSPGTPTELKQALQTIGPFEKPLILDLRDNAGGNLGAAVDAAGLFLKPGTTLLTVRTRDQSIPYTARDGSFADQPALILLQNGFTASAAEVFIAALVQNERAVSFGPATFGKGVSQKIVELSDGSALFITHAELIPPNGKPYHGRGIEATYQEP